MPPANVFVVAPLLLAAALSPAVRTNVLDPPSSDAAIAVHAPMASPPCDTAPSSARVLDALMARFGSQATLDGSDLHAEVTATRLLLFGVVYSEREKQLAQDLALDTYGVERVDNQIDVIDWAPITAPAQQQERDRRWARDHPAARSDAWIAAAVRHTLDASRATGSCTITVHVQGGSVTLVGTVRSEPAREHTVRNIADIYGVRAVDARQLAVRPDPPR
jgi:osmotically-inducible protein OsmY